MANLLSALVTIYSADMAAAAHFYGAVLGLAESYRFPQHGAPEHVEFKAGPATLAIGSAAGLRAHGMPPATPGHPFEIGLKTDNLEGLMARLRSAGVRILKEPETSAAGNLYAYIADPDGNWISIYQSMRAR